MTLKSTTVIGEIVEGEGGRYGGKIRVNDVVLGIIIPPKSIRRFEGIWLPSYKDVPGARSCFDSKANTIAMAEAGSPIAQKALTVEHDGHKDFALAARDVVEVLYRNFKPGTQPNYSSYRSGDNASSVPVGYPYTPTEPAQTRLALFQAGGEEAFDEEWVWTSTQSSTYPAFAQNFLNGTQSALRKGTEFAAVFVRLIHFTS